MKEVLSLNPWLSELGRVFAVVVLSVVLGVRIDHPYASLVVGVLGILTWHLYQLRQFEKWLRGGADTHPRDLSGVWGSVYRHVYHQRQRHRKRKRKLARYLKQFQESTAALPDAMVVLDDDGEIEWFNDAAGRVLGLETPQDIGQRLVKLWRHPALVMFLNDSDRSREDAIEVPAPAQRDIKLSVRVIDYGKNRTLLMARDITRLSRLEQVRREFVANVSHELRTPLTVILGYLEAMLDEAYGRSSRWHRSLQTMHHQAERMGRLISDLLFLSRLENSDHEPGRQEPVAVPALIAAVHEDAEQISAGRHTFDVDADPMVWLKGDREQLRSVCANLVDNAVKYTPDGGTIRIRWYADQQGAHLEVRDTGVGIPVQRIPRLTERFYRVDVGRSRESGGTGLGLAIVKHVLNRHGASLEIQSELGKGSSFSCRFPKERVLEQEPREAEVISLPRTS